MLEYCENIECDVASFKVRARPTCITLLYEAQFVPYRSSMLDCLANV